MPQNDVHVALVHSNIGSGAPPDEQDTLIVAQIVHDALFENGICVETLAYDENTLKDQLAALRPDLIFNLVESIEGNARQASRAPQFFEQLGYIHTGANAKTLDLTTDKISTKSVLKALHLPSPHWFGENEIEKIKNLPGPMILKPCAEDASIGIFHDSITDDADILRELLSARKHRFGGTWFAEDFIKGREIHVSLLEDSQGVRLLPAAEIDFSSFPANFPRIIDYDAKWDENSFQYNNTPYLFSSISPDLYLSINELALRCWDAFELKGWARIDFRLQGDGTLYIIDINASPCLAPQCIFYHAAQQDGLTYKGIVNAILSATLKTPTREKKIDHQR